MKLLIIISALLVVGLLEGTEPNLASDYAVTPFERCQEAYEGSKHITDCKELRK